MKTNNNIHKNYKYYTVYSKFINISQSSFIVNQITEYNEKSQWIYNTIENIFIKCQSSCTVK